MKQAATWMVALAAAALATAARAGGDLALTIYNGGFACVREARELDLREGENALRLTDMSAQLEPDSVILRETGTEPFGLDILEQRYVNDPLTQELMLREMEGREVRFRVTDKDGTHEETGTLVRSGWAPSGRYGRGSGGGPIVRMPDGVRFSLPGQPVFDGVDPAAFLKPSLEWVLRSGRAGKAPVEVSYLTGGLSWEATYNLVAPEDGGDEFALSGWVTIRNDSGKDYPGADLKLIAGDVHKAMPPRNDEFVAFGGGYDSPRQTKAMPQERAFDEFHLYTLPRRTTLKTGELKQIEFLRADGVKGVRQYVYEPLRGWHARHGDTGRTSGLNDEKKVGVYIDIRNSETNSLGVPLPAGRMRLYRQDAADGRPEFTGEDAIDHTPKDESIRLAAGCAFDLSAERTQTDFEIHTGAHELRESYEIKVRNHKAVPVEVRLAEHLWRWSNWEITAETAPHEKPASDRAEWLLPVPPGGEATLSYTVHYTWD